jgi:hypothetical protein
MVSLSLSLASSAIKEMVTVGSASWRSRFVSSFPASSSSYMMFMLLNSDIVGFEPGDIIAGKFGC